MPCLNYVNRRYVARVIAQVGALIHRFSRHFGHRTKTGPFATPRDLPRARSLQGRSK